MNRFWRDQLASYAAAGRQAGDDLFLDASPNEDVEMTSDDIRSRRFSTRRFGGLDPEEVAAFLDDVAEALYVAQRRHIEMATQVKLLEGELETLTNSQAFLAPSGTASPADQEAPPVARHADEKDDAVAASRLEMLRRTALQEVEALLHDAQVEAQSFTDSAHARAATILREADALKSQRQKEADQLVAEATVSAESILATARDQEASLRRDLDRLAESRLRMLDDLWATLNGCQEWLATVDPRRQRPDERTDRLDRVA